MIIQLLALINKVVYFYTILLIIYALLSWFPGAYDSSFGRFLRKICEPYLSLFDHLNLSLGPVNFNIAFAIIVLQLAVQAVTRLVFAIIV